MSFVLRAFSLLPMWLLQLLGWALGWLVYLLSPTWRKRFHDNAAQAGYRFAQVRAAVGHSGRMVAELPKVWFGPPVPVEIEAASRALLERLWGENTGNHTEEKTRRRGVLFITPHMGCFELSSQTVAQHLNMGEHSPRGPLVVLYRPARQKVLAELLQSVRNRHGQTAVPTDMGGVRAMLKTLRKGGAVGLLPDQVPPWGMGDWAAVFGKPAYTMTIAARLLAQTQPHVVIARCERLGLLAGKPRYRLYLQELHLDAQAGQTALVAQINRAVEQQIHACPDQYMWGYARYKVPRGMPEGERQPQRIEELQP